MPPVPSWIEIDAYAERFERGRASDPALEARACLPPADHPLWLDVLRELERVEEELRTADGSKPGPEGRGCYPELLPARVLARLSATQRIIIGKRFEGFDAPRIAAATGRSIRSVERVLREFRRELTDAFEVEDA